jgi:hypothetical protein
MDKAPYQSRAGICEGALRRFEVLDLLELRPVVDIVIQGVVQLTMPDGEFTP